MALACSGGTRRSGAVGAGSRQLSTTVAVPTSIAESALLNPGIWSDTVRALPGNREVAEVGQRTRERLVRERLDCRDPLPRTVRALAIPQPQQLALDVGVGVVHHAIQIGRASCRERV